MRQSLSIYKQVFLCAAIFSCILFFEPAFSAPHKQQDQLTRAEHYLQTLKTMKARFIQTAPDGGKTSGVFYLQRPGKMRFEYDEPIEDFIVADGSYIHFYDSEMEQQSSVSIGDSLADFILREDLSLSQDVTVTNVKTDKSDDTVHITLTQTSDPDAGALTLVFQRAPMRLLKWFIFDAQGKTTEVSLWEVETGVAFKDKKLFRYRDPKIDRPIYNE